MRRARHACEIQPQYNYNDIVEFFGGQTLLLLPNKKF